MPTDSHLRAWNDGELIRNGACESDEETLCLFVLAVGGPCITCIQHTFGSVGDPIVLIAHSVPTPATQSHATAEPYSGPGLRKGLEPCHMYEVYK